MTLCSQNTSGDPGPQASSGGAVLGTSASRFGIGGPTVGFAADPALKLAATG
jgi:hypothetical protein